MRPLLLEALAPVPGAVLAARDGPWRLNHDVG